MSILLISSERYIQLKELATLFLFFTRYDSYLTGDGVQQKNPPDNPAGFEYLINNKVC